MIVRILKKNIDTQARVTNAQGMKVEKLDNDVALMAKPMKMIEVHLGQIASSSNSQQKSKLPSTTKVNPKGHVNAIHLRTGTSYDGPSLPKEDVKMNGSEKAPITKRWKTRKIHAWSRLKK